MHFRLYQRGQDNQQCRLHAGCRGKEMGDDEIYKGYPTTTWLLYYRLKAGLTQAQLSKASGVNIRQIQRVELGEAESGNLSAKNIIALADALGVDVRALV